MDNHDRSIQKSTRNKYSLDSTFFPSSGDFLKRKTRFSWLTKRKHYREDTLYNYAIDMELRVYNGEHFERTNTRFIVFGVSLLVIIALSVWRMNFFGAIVLFLVAWGYVLFSLTKNKIISLIVRDSWLAIDTRLRIWDSLESFAMEADPTTRAIKNIVVMQKKWDIMIFSVSDTDENIEAFIDALQIHLPLIQMPPLSTIDKIIRRLKL